MGLLAFANEWSKKLPALAPQFEEQNRLPADIAKKFGEAGVFHMLVPTEYGGLEVHPSEFVEVLRTLAKGDGSAGWNAMIGSTTGLLSASMQEEYAREIYGDKPGVLSVGVTAPVGRADIVEGGFTVSGRWPFGSGCQNAQWVGGGCFVYENDKQVMGKFGPEVRIVMFRALDIEIEDTWHVSGLKGTGSHHFNADKVFVPQGRSIVMGSRPLVQRPLYQFPLLGLLALGVSSVSLGIGYAALEAFKNLAGVKSPTGSNRKLIERSMVQSEVAKSVADLESAEIYIHKVIEDAWSLASEGEKLSMEVKGKLRLAAVNATHKSVAAVDRLYELGGGSSIYENNVLQRCFRDVHVSTQHIMVAQPIYEVCGKIELGMELKQPI